MRKRSLQFRIISKNRKGAVLILAPHGGLIEFGTSEIAKNIAGRKHSCYLYEGLKPKNNWSLHTSSTKYSEPTALRMAKEKEIILTIHGCKETRKFAVVGGLHIELASSIISNLKENSFLINPANQRRFPARNPDNICNKGKSGRGVQIEISSGLRSELVKNRSRLDSFSSAINEAISRFL